MKRRDFLKGGAGLITAAASGPAAAQDASPRVLELFKFNWCHGKPRLRRNIYTLYNSNPNHPTIVAYRNAVALMKTRPATDPTSWLYQANIHGTYVPPGGRPVGAPWATCEHSFHFLSWHRMYLYFFERIVRAASGDPNFALPYWDYEPAAHRFLPPPFCGAPVNPATNALLDTTRPAALNDGTGSLPPSAVSPAVALSKTSFFSPDLFQNSVKLTPHNSVHGAISGHMGTFEEAGQDPIFWLHHCNIDRLWEKWLSQGGGRVNPTGDSTWMNTNFKFVDENKNFVNMSGDDVLYTVNQLNYQYEDPRACVLPSWYYLLASANFTSVSAKARVLATLVLARNVKPTSDQARIDLRTEDGDTRERLAKAVAFDQISKAVESGTRYLLVFERVRTEAPLNGYFEVYLGLPRDGKPDPDGPHYVGNLTMFGADAKSRQTVKSGHAGHTDSDQHVTLEVTEPLKRLVERGDIKNDMPVTLVPAGVAKSPNERFTFDPKANPQIDAIVLTMEKYE